MEENNSSERRAFYNKLQDKSDHYLILLLQRVVLSLRRHERKLAKDGLTAPYKADDLERAVQAFAQSRADLLALLFLVYADPYLNMLQAQNILNSTSMTTRQADPVPAGDSGRTSSLFSDYTPKSNLSKYNGLFGGKKRGTRRGRSRKSRRGR